MSHDVINSWIEKAKSGPESAAQTQGVQVIKRVETRGTVIMDVADRIRPYLAKMFEGVRDDEGQLLQPAHIRGLALNVAQGLVKNQESKN